MRGQTQHHKCSVTLGKSFQLMKSWLPCLQGRKLASVTGTCSYPCASPKFSFCKGSMSLHLRAFSSHRNMLHPHAGQTRRAWKTMSLEVGLHQLQTGAGDQWPIFLIDHVVWLSSVLHAPQHTQEDCTPVMYSSNPFIIAFYLHCFPSLPQLTSPFLHFSMHFLASPPK